MAESDIQFIVQKFKFIVVESSDRLIMSLRIIAKNHQICIPFGQITIIG